jgi:hypothetical protein
MRETKVDCTNIPSSSRRAATTGFRVPANQLPYYQSAPANSIGCCSLLHQSIYLSITHSLTHSFINHYYWHGHVLGSFHPILSLCSYVSGVCITLGV